MNPLKFIHTLNENEPEMARREYITRNVLFFMFIVTFSFALISFILYLFGKMPLDTLMIYAVESIILIAAMFLAEAGFWQAVGIIPPLLMYFPAVRANYIGGIDAPGNFMYALLIMFVAIIYGHRKMWIALAICIATYLCLVWMISTGYIKPYRTADVVFANRVVLISGFLVGIALMIWLLGRSYRSEINVRIKAEELLSKRNEELGILNEALRKSEERHRLIMENTADLISIIDMNLRFTYVSSATIGLRGFTVEEAMEQPLEQVLTPESMRLALAVFEEEMQLEASGTSDPDRTRILELEEYKKDGSTIWVEVSLSFLRDKNGKPLEIIMVTRDLTERTQAEASLQLSEQNYRLLAAYHKRLNEIAIEFTETSDTEDLYNRIAGSLRLLTNAIAATFSVYNRETRTLKVVSLSTDPISRGTANAIFGPELFEIHMPVSTDEMAHMLSTGIRKLKDLYQLSFGVIPQEISDAVTDAVGCRQIVALAISYDEELIGTCVAYLPGDQPLVPDEALKTYMYLSAVAIKREQQKEEKHILQERLQHAAKLEAIGTLAGGIAHDFNNLLMGIQGYATMTLRNLNQDDPNYERIKRIEQQVQSGADLNKQLLGFARRGRYEVKPTDMNDVIEKSSSMFGRTKKEIVIDKKYKKDLWNVEADRGQMEQVFMNLFVNSWQAMPGGGNIYLETWNVLLDDEETLPYLVKPGRYVKIKVTDTGAGMDEKTKEKIFEPFFTTKTMGRGTGLGLATVYGIIKGHQGMITVESEPSRGTTFTIYLPASEKEVQMESTPDEKIVTGTETILLVDDEQIVIEVNKELLESMGYKIYAAGSGQEAIAVYREKTAKIDLVILDMIMPGISGSETFERLRKINPNVKVILLSGYSLSGEAQTIMDRGCNGFLQKPFHLEALSSKVREMLD